MKQISLLLFTVIFSGISYASYDEIECNVNDSFWTKFNLNVSTLSSVLSSINAKSVDLLTAESVCTRKVNFEQNCRIEDKSIAQQKFTNITISCYKDKNSEGQWLAIFDIVFAKDGSGMLHCNTSLGQQYNYHISSCLKK